VNDEALLIVMVYGVIESIIHNSRFDPIPKGQKYNEKIKLPYGISNFKRLITDGYYYIDKTKYIKLFELKPKTSLYGFMVYLCYRT